MLAPAAGSEEGSAIEGLVDLGRSSAPPVAILSCEYDVCKG